MTTQTATVKVVSTDPASQGPFVIINEADFDEAVHELYTAATDAPKKRSAKPTPTTEA